MVHAAWRKHGAPALSVLAVVENADLLETEKRAIAAVGTLKPGGYNMTPGGDFNPMGDPEFVAKTTAAATGRRHTPEAKAKMSVARKRNPTPPHIQALAAAAVRGKPTLHMMGENNPNKRPEVRAKKSLASKGVPKSPEHRAKLAEHCLRMVATRLAKKAAS